MAGDGIGRHKEYIGGPSMDRMETIMTRPAAPALAFLLAGLVALPTPSALAHQSDTPTTDGASPSVDRVLAAMDRTSTWGHPDLFNEFAGMHRLKAHDYKAAMKFFKEASRYADKLSQLSVGLMYLNGQGVAKDPVTAFAWVAISAERKYPRFLATRDAIWSTLDADQRERAKALVAQLYTEYGDPVAKKRMARALNLAKLQMTGSYLGFGTSSVSTVSADSVPAACGAETIDGAAQVGCGNIYAAWRWDPKQYFQVRDGAWKGTVTVGAIDQAGQAAGGAGVKHHDTRKDIQK
jgi:uncharacterized protein